MLKRWSWFAVCFFVITSAFTFAAQAAPEKKNHKQVQSAKAKASKKAAAPKNNEDEGGEVGLDSSLRTKAAAMPVKTADGSALDTLASHAMLIDFETGTVLAEKAGNEKMYPSSMTKIMTLYVLFERLKEGAIGLNSQFMVSEKAWRMQGSKMFVPLGEQIGLEDLIRGIAIQSGNDACIVVAEGIAGSEDAFAKQMNDTAKKIGMTNSNFTDASGWPHPEHTTTAHDLAVLGVALIRDFPQYYHYVSEREFTFHGIRQFNRNLLLDDPSIKVDGIKTGHTEAAGYGIVLSAVDPQSQRRLVLVINGLDSSAARAQEGERLLKWGLQNFINRTIFRAGAEIAKAPVWMGHAREVGLAVASDVKITVPRTGKTVTTAAISYPSPLLAPVTQGQEVGTLTLTFADGSTKKVPLVATAAVEKLSMLGRVGRALGL
jgi:D-alanyl-D-alanine carboxypeptidase (penicillin-binding protein 5/6)